MELRKLSMTSKSFWLNVVIREGIILPLATHRPLSSFTAKELHGAAHKAIIRDRNLAAPHVKLLSHIRIPWPLVFLDGEPDEFITTLSEGPIQTHKSNLIHPNGEWIFLFSATHVLRILHLRSGRMAWAGQMETISGFNVNDYQCVASALDFRGDSEIWLTMAIESRIQEPRSSITGEDMNPKKGQAILYVTRLLLCHQEVAVQWEKLAMCRVDHVPSRMDIAGDHIVFLERGMDAHVSGQEIGSMYIFNWRNSTFAPTLEGLLPAVSFAIFQEYSISIGISTTGAVFLQVVAFLDLAESDSISQPISLRYVLTANIPLLTSLPSRPRISPMICHRYLGRIRNGISIWVAEKHQIPMWMIFDFDVNFGHSPERWFSAFDRGCATAVPKRVVDTFHATHWALPMSDGRRFLAMETYEFPSPVSATGMFEFALHMSIGRIDTVPSLGDLPTFATRTESRDYHEQHSSTYPRSVLESTITCLADEDRSRRFVYEFNLGDWSGNAVILLKDGTIWVLRYGRP
ncbi:hypothetical protein CPB86DRAFT_778257 [Serendipita vermifera]|nr:hypothetical protein CPB86DRAFT_778257 [Serendipita vermifera]